MIAIIKTVVEDAYVREDEGRLQRTRSELTDKAIVG